MTPRKLAKLKKELEALRRAPQKALAIERLAKKLGRKIANRGKEPVWESTEFNALFPFSIPHHGGRDLPVGTRNSVLNQLEDDIFAWEERLVEDGDGPDSKA